jgi:hypothetical protein
MGIQAVIAPSFGDIFFQNSFKNGLVAITLDRSSAEPLHRAAEQAPDAFCVDLETCEITGPGVAIGFEINQRRRETLMRGLDEIEATLLLVDAIESFQAQDRATRPWVYNSAAPSRPLDATVLASPLGLASESQREILTNRYPSEGKSCNAPRNTRPTWETSDPR